MSTIHHACCCEEGAPCGCTAANTCYASSYLIPAIDVLYTFNYQAANVKPCAQCGQNCGWIGWTIQCQVTAANLTVTRDGGGTEPCCYRWRGQVNVDYSLTVNAERRCVGTNCPRVWTQTFTGSRTVDACLDVTCTECGNWQGCGATFLNQSVWRHALRICDFAVDCNVDLEGLQYVDSFGATQCGLWTTDCDPVIEPCQDCTVAASIWCVGGGVEYISELQALDAIGVGGMKCHGWRAGPVCTDDCAVHTNWTTTKGPFAATIREECGEQDPQQCIGLSASDPLFRTRFGTFWDTYLSNYCGSVDESFLGTCFDEDLQQGSCAGQGWVYT